MYLFVVVVLIIQNVTTEHTMADACAAIFHCLSAIELCTYFGKPRTRNCVLLCDWIIWSQSQLSRKNQRPVNHEGQLYHSGKQTMKSQLKVWFSAHDTRQYTSEDWGKYNCIVSSHWDFPLGKFGFLSRGKQAATESHYSPYSASWVVLVLP